MTARTTSPSEARTGPVTTIVASAGTGKTYTLVQRIRDAVLEDGLAPARIVATTFTNRAAGELAGRIRQGLLEKGATDSATEMLTARIGTVNAVAGTLVGEFALELGRSPDSEVIDEDRARTAFRQATGAVMLEHAEQLTRLTERLGIDDDGGRTPWNRADGWRDVVQKIVDTARSNGIAADDLATSAEHSAASFAALLPEPVATAEELDDGLARAIEACRASLTTEVRAGLKKTTRDKDVSTLDEAVARLASRQRLRWRDWARLAKLGATKADAWRFETVIAAASQHLRHPGLAADVDAFTRGLFACAADCLRAYAAYKAERGLVDFVDQEALALQLLRDPANAERLREMIGAVYVDEFQDSSPIQVALFTELARVARHSAWVGDPKQSIYAFRGAAPELTTLAARRIATDSGGGIDYLGTSYRARPSLVRFVDAAFGPPFARAGFSPEEVAFSGANRSERDGASSAFARWDVQGRNAGVRAGRLAAAVDHLLGSPVDWAIESDGARPPRGADVAILCRSNAAVTEIATALGARGLRVAVARPGLMAQPEVELLVAALRWIADRRDTLAAAELARLAGRDERAWLEVAFDEDQDAAFHAAVTVAADLAALRDRRHDLTPAEVLNAVLNVDGVLDVVRGWGDAEARLASLEALRDLAEEYQTSERAARRSVTLAGLCARLTEDDPGQPQSAHPDAVHVLTYHGAKGLEWPIVVLADLDKEPKASPFGLTAETDDGADPSGSDRSGSDRSDPLANRRLRYWPWPYGAQKKGTGLDEAATEAPQGRAAAQHELLERTRLLYVGATRAKDHLVFAVNGKKTQTWLEELRGEDGTKLVTFDGDRMQVGPRSFDMKPAIDLAALPDHVAQPDPEHMPLPTDRVDHPPQRLRPSGASVRRTPEIVEIVRLGDRIALAGTPDMRALGEACHGFFAWDASDRSDERRHSQARAILGRWGVAQLSADDLVTMSDRLRTFLTRRFPGATPRHEWPLHVPRGLQVVAGRIDLLVDLGSAFAVVDHKSFPARIEGDEDRLRAFAGQAALYAEAVEAATGRPCREFWLHQPVVGRASRIAIEPDGDGSGRDGSGAP